MKILGFLAFFLVSLNVLAQEEKYPGRVYYTYDENTKLEEYLSFEVNNELLYWNDQKLDKIKLEIASGSREEGLLVVKFPGSEENYQLKFSEDHLFMFCTNPNGSIQRFEPPLMCIPDLSKYTTTNANGTKEHIFVYYFPTPREFYYESSINPQRVKLNDELDTDNNADGHSLNNYKVKFPESSEVYHLKLIWDKNQIICTNPNGSKQTFEQEW